MRFSAAISMAVLCIASVAHAADVQAVLKPLRSQIEASDYSATGRLVRVDPDGNRTNYAVSVKGLWFAGALHTLVDVVPPADPSARGRQGGQVRILLETHSDGRDVIRIFRPHESEPTTLPFDKWDESLWGGALSYEDLLDAQYFWPDQTIVKSVACNGHPCSVLKSTPGPSDRTHYSQVQTWVDGTIDYPTSAEKVTKQGGAIKEFTYYGLRKSSGVWSATQVEAKIQGRAGSTFLIIKRGSAKANLSVRDFNLEQINHFEDRP